MITITDTDLEKLLKTLLQRKLDFIIHKKIWRTGRLLLFKLCGFYLEFTIRNDKDKIEKFEVPFPFDFIQTYNGIKFSYELKTLTCNNPKLIEDIKKIGAGCKSKYFNSFMEIRVT